MASGKRIGPKKKRSTLRPSTLLLAIGITAGVIAWGYLVKAAIDFGISARNGTPGAWMYLALASVGAVACLFVGLMLVARLLHTLGLTSDRGTPSREVPSGGHRSR